MYDTFTRSACETHARFDHARPVTPYRLRSFLTRFCLFAVKHVVACWRPAGGLGVPGREPQAGQCSAVAALRRDE